MSPLARVAVAVVGGLHLAYMGVELFLWRRLVPVLGIYTQDRADATAAVGANMGAYNGVLGVILLWLAWDAPSLGDRPARAFAAALLLGVVVAGVFGGATIKWTIPLFQSLPALVALGLLWRRA
jgi:putative membrane protein